MKSKNTEQETLPPLEVMRVNPSIETGLNAAQVQERMMAGLQNHQPNNLTPSVGEIVRSNVFTLFNFINLFLAAVLIIVGEYKNAFFLGVAICNTLMGIIQELRSKRTLDKLSIVSKSKVRVVRDGQFQEIDQNDIVLDDIMVLNTGNQICSDSVVISGEGFQVNESLLTGESDAIYKNSGDSVMSGSFVTAGSAYVQVAAIGSNNFATALTVEAKKTKNKKSQLMTTLNRIIFILTIVIIPLGMILFLRQWTADSNFTESILGATSSMIGMIPEGLILLTSVTMTVGALNLAKKKALVQSLPSIETLARVDVLCLDKTGTITDGTLSFEELSLQNGYSQETVSEAIAFTMAALHDENATAIALREAFPMNSPIVPALITVPFSSARKWSAVAFENVGTYVIGAPNFVFSTPQPFTETVDQYASLGYRVLCVAFSKNYIENDTLPEELECLALIVLSDTIRKEAPDTFAYFEKENVTLKVISGDDPLTVSTIAQKAGLANAEYYVDMSQYGDDDDFTELVENVSVFGRVSPHQKRGLIRAMQNNGHTTCMTGDGVNDVLAMKEADCSVAMINGSDAARSACDFVLMTSNFSAMINVLQEGRRVINNIETVACMYLVKTIYSTLLTIIYIFLGLPYPFKPVQMGPINAFTVGIPSFFLSLRANYKRPEGRFIKNVLEIALPAALTVVFSILYVQLLQNWFDVSQQDLYTMNVLLTGTIGLFVLQKIAKPMDKKIIAMFALCVIGFYGSFFFFKLFFGYDWFYEFSNLLSRNILFYLPLIFMVFYMFNFLENFTKTIESFFAKIKNKKKKSIQS